MIAAGAVCPLNSLVFISRPIKQDIRDGRIWDCRPRERALKEEWRIRRPLPKSPCRWQKVKGEHVDYCGYAVLPMALEQDILAAVTPTKTKLIQLANTNPVYLDYNVHINKIHIDTTKPQWHNYFLCGFKGIQEHFNLTAGGMNCVVDGTIPASSGLSSSSALVCCAGLITMIANQKVLSKVELAEICAKCERYIGTEGGGMDQSISFLAEKGTAKLIEFNPVRATNVKLPQGAVFVIANSCREMNKAATAHYNIRVVECRLATKILAKAKGLEWQKLSKLGDLQTELGVSLETMISTIELILHPEPYSRVEVCQHLGISQEELCSSILSQNTQDGSIRLKANRALIHCM
ncbi:hypothetical protein scyTo_0013230 [Scyliorhinus torazame]|uniref:GHMP kinase N-terminal domain-containing protein n=1 Tax=Scyliorhinus torazame TaxID=75743 RepID=A0A401NS06_SCYTO|nr:hypothetical protein [Scyliorhinus torazame]